MNYFILLLSIFLTACADDYDFANVDMGDSKSDVLAIMGEPVHSESLQLPLGVQTERLTWENKASDSIYKADFFLGKVIDKNIEKY